MVIGAELKEREVWTGRYEGKLLAPLTEAELVLALPSCLGI